MRPTDRLIAKLHQGKRPSHDSIVESLPHPPLQSRNFAATTSDRRQNPPCRRFNLPRNAPSTRTTPTKTQYRRSRFFFAPAAFHCICVAKIQARCVVLLWRRRVACRLCPAMGPARRGPSLFAGRDARRLRLGRYPPPSRTCGRAPCSPWPACRRLSSR